jgi:hypothetical protein
VTDIGLLHFKGMKKLKSVNLILTKVTDKGIADLQKALPKARVFNKLSGDQAERRAGMSPVGSAI